MAMAEEGCELGHLYVDIEPFPVLTLHCGYSEGMAQIMQSGP
jgi:hypothetical protein